MTAKDDCTEQPCPYKGYTDTKKCWFHSQGLPLPPNARNDDCVFDGPSRTFAEELADEQAHLHQEV
jgi:hypothetical protein